MCVYVVTGHIAATTCADSLWPATWLVWHPSPSSIRMHGSLPSSCSTVVDVVLTVVTPFCVLVCCCSDAPEARLMAAAIPAINMLRCGNTQHGPLWCESNWSARPSRGSAHTKAVRKSRRQMLANIMRVQSAHSWAGKTPSPCLLDSSLRCSTRLPVAQ